jgi:hypothetical protein
LPSVAVPVVTVPRNVVSRVHSACGRSPFRVRSLLVHPSGPSAGSALPEVSTPLGGTPWASSTVRGAVSFPPRIRSQVFSTSQRFLQAQVSWPCFMPQPSAGCPPSESSPRRDRGVLSDPLAASVIRSRALCTPPDVFTPDFTDARAFGAFAWIPTDAEEAHSPDRSRDPGHPAPGRAEPQRSASLTRFAAFFPLRVRSHQPELPPTSGRSSPGRSSPLEPSPPQPRILGPAPACAGTPVGASRLQKATHRTSQPYEPGDTPPNE